MQILNISIDLNKIDKSKVVSKDKNGNPFKDGKKFYNLTVTVFDEPDKFGNNVSVTEPQTKEQREAKEPKKYLGNGKVSFSKSNTTNDTQATYTTRDGVTTKDDDDLPFTLLALIGIASAMFTVTF